MAGSLASLPKPTPRFLSYSSVPTCVKWHMYKVVYCSTICSSKDWWHLKGPSTWVGYIMTQGYKEITDNVLIRKSEDDLQDIMLRGKNKPQKNMNYMRPLLKKGKDWLILLSGCMRVGLLLSSVTPVSLRMRNTFKWEKVWNKVAVNEGEQDSQQ